MRAMPAESRTMCVACTPGCGRSADRVPAAREARWPSAFRLPPVASCTERYVALWVQISYERAAGRGVRFCLRKPSVFGDDFFQFCIYFLKFRIYCRNLLHDRGVVPWVTRRASIQRSEDRTGQGPHGVGQRHAGKCEQEPFAHGLASCVQARGRRCGAARFGRCGLLGQIHLRQERLGKTLGVGIHHRDAVLRDARRYICGTVASCCRTSFV